MSWQLGAFAVLAVGLAGGFAWYERTRPDARVVALVATLAAVGALGRIAFAALPNVKPTTDIVLISGLALGAAPGFVVGALAGLTSNFFFGQGPWTPWQMAAWGVVGVLGAVLARVAERGGRPIGRWRLAAVCAVVGYAFTAVQDVGDWVNYSDHSLASLGIYVGRGTGFDLVHAGGCLMFALAFGPALAHSLRRFTARLEISWRPAEGMAVPVLVLAMALAAVSLTMAGAPAAEAATSPSGYLLGAQNGDGGFGPSPGGGSSSLYSGWTALGLASAGHNPADVSRGGSTLLGYIEGNGGSYSDPGSLERTILVAGAAGVPASNFGGHDLLAMLGRQIGGDGSVNDQVNLTAFAVLALRGAGAPVPGRMLGWLARQQDGDGGFSFSAAGAASDVDDTGAVLEALGVWRRVTTRAVHFIRRQQNSDGGFPSQTGQSSNAQSTAWAIQGLLAAGVDPGSLQGGGTPSPLAYLQSLVAPDGHVRYSSSSDQTPVWVTAEALMALQERPLPLAAVTSAGGGSVVAGRRGRGRHTSAAARRRARRRHHRRQARRAGGGLSGLAADAGVVAAVAFAPVGVS